MFDVKVCFHAPLGSALFNARDALEAIRPFAGWLADKDASFGEWYLQGESLEEAQRFKAFDPGMNGNDAAVAILNQQFGGGVSVIGLWNGRDADGLGATMTLSITEGPYASELTLHLSGSRGSSRIGNYKDVAECLLLGVRRFNPVCAHVYEPTSYKLVYDDRVGVGWMIYLPVKISINDVPEARAVIPVTLDGGAEGTILVSVIDAVFNEKNREHTDIAHAIETRLVDLELLPTFVQLLRPAGH